MLETLICWQALNKKVLHWSSSPLAMRELWFLISSNKHFHMQNLMTSLRWALCYIELCFYVLMFHEPKSWSLMVVKYGIKMCLIFYVYIVFYPILLIQNSFELKQTLSYKKSSCTFQNFDPNVLLPFYVHLSPTHHRNPRGV